MDFYQNDPYEILNISHNSSDRQIKEAFYQKIRENKDNTQDVTQAYSLIKDEKARNNYLWSSVFGQITSFEEPLCILSDDEKEKFVREVAFLSDWILCL